MEIHYKEKRSIPLMSGTTFLEPGSLVHHLCTTISVVAFLSARSNEFSMYEKKIASVLHHTLLRVGVVFSPGIMTGRATPLWPALLAQYQLRRKYRYSLFLNKQFQTKYAKSNQDLNGGPN